MKKPLKKNVLKALFLLTLVSSFLHSYAYAQAIKGNVADAVKEARDAEMKAKEAYMGAKKALTSEKKAQRAREKANKQAAKARDMEM